MSEKKIKTPRNWEMKAICSRQGQFDRERTVSDETMKQNESEKSEQNEYTVAYKKPAKPVAQEGLTHYQY